MSEDNEVRLAREREEFREKAESLEEENDRLKAELAELRAEAGPAMSMEEFKAVNNAINLYEGCKVERCHCGLCDCPGWKLVPQRTQAEREALVRYVFTDQTPGILEAARKAGEEMVRRYEEEVAKAMGILQK